MVGDASVPRLGPEVVEICWMTPLDAVPAAIETKLFDKFSGVIIFPLL